MAKNRRGLKVFLVILLIFFAALVTVFFTIEGIVKGKLVRAIEENTEFNISIAVLSFRGMHAADLSGIELEPKLNKQDFNKNNGHQKDWIKLKCDHITLEGLNWLELIMTKHINLEKLVLDKPNIYAYRNKKYPQPPYQYKPLPGEQLRTTKLVITIPLVEMKNGTIAYEELPEKGDEAGTVKFSELYGSMFDLSTDENYYAQHPTIIVEGKGKILDSIPAEMTYKFHPANDKFSFEGKVKSFSATVLNKASNPLANAEIESGHVNWVHLKFDGNNRQSSGSLDISYRDLKIKVLQKEEEKKSTLKSMIANLVVHKKVEPETGDKESTGEIKFERRKDRYIFNYWWNSLKSGIATSVTSINIPKKKK